MKKNILKSILITNFIVVTFMLIFLYVYTNISINYIGNANEDETGRHVYTEQGKYFEELLDTVEGDDRFFQEGQILDFISRSGTIYSIRLLTYSIIFSITIGIGIGYLITIIDNSQKTNLIIKKVLVAYLIGLLLSTGIIALLEQIEYKTIDPPVILIITISWTVVFTLTLLVKKVVDNKKAKNLKNLFELTKKTEKQ